MENVVVQGWKDAFKHDQDHADSNVDLDTGGEPPHQQGWVAKRPGIAEEGHVHQFARAEAAGDPQGRLQFAPQRTEPVGLLGDCDDSRVGGHQVPEAKREALGPAHDAVEDRQPLRAVPLPQLVFRAVELLVHGQQPDKVGVQRACWDASTAGAYRRWMSAAVGCFTSATYREQLGDVSTASYPAPADAAARGPRDGMALW